MLASLRVAALLLTLSGLLAACGGDEALVVPPAGSGSFDLAELDEAVDPCVDLDAYANRRWLDAHPIAPEEASTSTLALLDDAISADLRGMLETAAARAAQLPPGALERLLGHYYGSGMDLAAIRSHGLAPVQPALDAIAAIDGPEALARHLGVLARQGHDEVFQLYVLPALDEPDTNLLSLNPPELALPAASDYADPQEQALRDAYLDYMAGLFELAGASSAAARAQAQTAFAFEARLAREIPPPEDLITPASQFRRVARAELEAGPRGGFWAAYLEGLGLPAMTTLSVAPQGYAGHVAELAYRADLQTWRTYLRWRALEHASRYLDEDWIAVRYRYRRGALAGIDAPLPRWRHVLDALDATAGMPLGQLYVQHHGDAGQRAQVLAYVEDVRDALLRRIDNADWLSEPTRQEARRKLASTMLYVGYPDRWDDWSPVPAGTADSFYPHAQRTLARQRAFDLALVGQPRDRARWPQSHPPHVVNAVYDLHANAVTLPLAILQPPLLDANADAALILGALGALAGHELTHAIDNDGATLDADGRLRDWWTPADLARFEQQGAALVAQAEAYVPLPDDPGLRMNGQLTLGENIADLGGVAAAYDALADGIAAGRYDGRRVDGQTPQQRFFLAWARLWRERMREPLLRDLLRTDPHAPPTFRVNNPPANLPAYAQAFGCAPGSPMARPLDERVRLW